MAGGVDILLYREGRSTPFSDWLARLKDLRTAGIIRARLNRIRLGNFGDCRSVGGGVEELRIDFGPGYRVYFGRQSSVVVVLLCGGSKGTQNPGHRRRSEVLEGVFECQGSSRRNRIGTDFLKPSGIPTTGHIT
jgi:putative addiction module killer protein